VAPINVAVALVPVLLFLGLLVFLDSFKLVSLRSVLVALVAWALAALAGTQANGWLLDATGLPTHAFSRYVAPLVEETLKALWIVLLLRRGRVGFLVDAAILGFAVGAGFALVENVEYLRALAEPRVLLWLARGFGTAILHKATTAVFALLAKMLADRHPGRPVLALVPGLLAASTRSTTTSWCRRSSPRASSSSACPSWSSPSSSAASGPPGSGWAWGSTATSSCSSRSLPGRRSRRASASTCAR
jgi:RsiW-degrading membrane proteinase PrsW (M82 family)